MGCTESRNLLSAFGRNKRRKLTLRWRRWRIGKIVDKPDSRTSSRIQNVSEILSKSPRDAKPNGTTPKSKQEITMSEVLQHNISDEISLTRGLVVDNNQDDDDETYLQVIEEKIKMWKIESCLRATNSRPQAAKGPRKPVGENHFTSINADVRKLEQDMQAVIDGVDQPKSLSSLANDNRIQMKTGQEFCISQISSDKRVRPGAARGFRTPCTVVSAEEYVLPGAILELPDTTARAHLVNGSTTKQDQCLRIWMERQTNKESQN